MLDWNQCPAVERSPKRVSGAWVFKGTRVPVRALFENLDEGASVDEFLAWFPGVNRDQVHAVLAYASESVAGAGGATGMVDGLLGLILRQQTGASPPTVKQT